MERNIFCVRLLRQSNLCPNGNFGHPRSLTDLIALNFSTTRLHVGVGTWQFSVLVCLWDGGVDQALLGAEGVELVFGRVDLYFERTLSSHTLM